MLTRAVTHIRLLEANTGKLGALDALVTVYLELCQRYTTLFCQAECTPDKWGEPVFETELSDRLHRVAMQQAAGIARSFRSNRARAYRAYLEDLARYQRARAEAEAQGRLASFKQREPTWTEWNLPVLRVPVLRVPVLRVPVLRANVGVVVVEPSADSTFDYWLRISTLDKRKPIRVPVKLASYHKQALAGKTLNTSTTLSKRKGVWWLTLSFDEEIPVQVASDAPVVRVDVGIASATRGRVHNCFMRLSRRSEASCSTSSTLERRSGEVTSRCRSPLTTFLNHPIADRLEPKGTVVGRGTWRWPLVDIQH